VHFKSSDKKKLQNFGDFWHFTVITGTIIVAQDEIDTYTVHRLVPPGADFEIGDPEKFINESLGGIGGPADIKIDETIVSGKWQANLSIADSFRSDKGRIFLAGDAGK
jgi:FAD-dependent monooxygenase